jgi:hypothetical protein
MGTANRTARMAARRARSSVEVKQIINSKSAVTGSNIIEDVVLFIRRFVFIREEALYYLAATWIIATYLADVFDYFGYLFIYSAEPQSGKSRLLSILDYLVKDSSGKLVSPTEAVLFRTASKTTLLLDEVDTWVHTDSLKAVLNAGFERNTGVWRNHEGNGGWELKKYPVFGPKALAGIGMSILPSPTLDRTFRFEMVRQTKTEKRERLAIRRVEPVAKELKARILKWVKTEKNRVQEIYDEPESVISYLDEYGDRTFDIALPIAAIIEAAYIDRAELQRVRTLFRKALDSTRNERPSSQHCNVIRQLLEIGRQTEKDPLIGNASELSQQFVTLLRETVLADTISSALRHYGFTTKSHRLGARPASGMSWRRRS